MMNQNQEFEIFESNESCKQDSSLPRQGHLATYKGFDYAENNGSTIKLIREINIFH